MQALNLKIDSTPGATITVLEGKAPIQKQEVKVNIEGDILAVANYLRVRNPSPDDSHILVDKQQGTIVLIQKENCDQSITVTGKFTPNANLTALGINTDKKYLPNELISALRFSKFLFESPIQVQTVIDKIRKISVSVQTKINQNQATQSGSKSSSFEKISDAECMSLVLLCELFSGGKKEKMTVEIWTEVEGTGVRYWLECESMYNTKMESANLMIDEAIELIKIHLGENLIPIICK